MIIKHTNTQRKFELALIDVSATDPRFTFFLIFNYTENSLANEIKALRML